jgi:hypothetical protein
MRRGEERRGEEREKGEREGRRSLLHCFIIS